MTLELNKIHQGDCLKLISLIPEKSINMVLCDLPYGVTQNKLDIKLNMEKWWIEIERVTKQNSAVILTSMFPFTTELLIGSKLPFRYDLIWNKGLVSGFLNAKRMPLRCHEHILVFYKKQPVYNPIFETGNPLHGKGTSYLTKKLTNNNYGEFGKLEDIRKGSKQKYPKSIININRKHPSIMKHPTEKPIELAMWLIETYSNKGELVLDTCIGTGWTAIACKKTNRNFIGIELNKKYCQIAIERLR